MCGQAFGMPTNVTLQVESILDLGHKDRAYKPRLAMDAAADAGEGVLHLSVRLPLEPGLRVASFSCLAERG